MSSPRYGSRKKQEVSTPRYAGKEEQEVSTPRYASRNSRRDSSVTYPVQQGGAGGIPTRYSREEQEVYPPG